jgi:hypothetical protein
MNGIGIFLFLFAWVAVMGLSAGIDRNTKRIHRLEKWRHDRWKKNTDETALDKEVSDTSKTEVQIEES